MQFRLSKLSVALVAFSASVFAADQGDFSTSYGTNAGINQSHNADYNTSIGENANMGNTSGDDNTIVGYRAGEANTVSDNTFFGALAGLVSETGYDLVIIGTRAGESITQYSDNIFIGTDAGPDCNGCFDNTVVGVTAGYYLTTGKDNTFIGERSGHNVSEGELNTYIGQDAGYSSNGLGRFNVAFGYEAGWSIEETSSRNTYLGAGAGARTDTNAFGNTAVGADALAAPYHSDWNTFIGVQAGRENHRFSSATTAVRNTGAGSFAGVYNVKGADNAWLGAFTGTMTSQYVYDATLESSVVTDAETGLHSYLDGSPSGEDTVHRSVVFGGFANVSENDSTAFGYGVQINAKYAVQLGNSGEIETDGSISIGNETQSNHNKVVLLGYQLQSVKDNGVTLGNHNTLFINPQADAITSLGTAEDCSYSTGTSSWSCNTPYQFTNVVSNGVFAYGSEADSASIQLWADHGEDYDDRWQLVVDDGSGLSIASNANSSFDSGSGEDIQSNSILSFDTSGDMTIDGDFNVNSDQRLKTHISNIDEADQLVASIQPVTYQWRLELARSTKSQYGVIAQQVEQVVPELVSENAEGVKSVNYQALVPLLLNQIKAQQQRVEHNRKMLNIQQQQVSQLKILLAKNSALNTLSKP